MRKTPLLGRSTLSFEVQDGILDISSILQGINEDTARQQFEISEIGSIQGILNEFKEKIAKSKKSPNNEKNPNSELRHEKKTEKIGGDTKEAKEDSRSNTCNDRVMKRTNSMKNKENMPESSKTCNILLPARINQRRVQASSKGNILTEYNRGSVSVPENIVDLPREIRTEETVLISKNNDVGCKKLKMEWKLKDEASTSAPLSEYATKISVEKKSTYCSTKRKILEKIITSRIKLSQQKNVASDGSSDNNDDSERTVRTEKKKSEKEKKSQESSDQGKSDIENSLSQAASKKSTNEASSSSMPNSTSSSSNESKFKLLKSSSPISNKAGISEYSESIELKENKSEEESTSRTSEVSKSVKSTKTYEDDKREKSQNKTNLLSTSTPKEVYENTKEQSKPNSSKSIDSLKYNEFHEPSGRNKRQSSSKSENTKMHRNNESDSSSMSQDEKARNFKRKMKKRNTCTLTDHSKESPTSSAQSYLPKPDTVNPSGLTNKQLLFKKIKEHLQDDKKRRKNTKHTAKTVNYHMNKLRYHLKKIITQVEEIEDIIDLNLNTNDVTSTKVDSESDLESARNSESESDDDYSDTDSDFDGISGSDLLQVSSIIQSADRSSSSTEDSNCSCVNCRDKSPSSRIKCRCHMLDTDEN